MHRVADEEESLRRVHIIGRISLIPPGNEFFKQRDLRVGTVLELVHQQMMDAVIEGQHQIRGRFGITQRQIGALRDFDEIGLAARGEHQLQLRHGQRQKTGDGPEHLPLRLGVRSRGQGAQCMQCVGETGNTVEALNQNRGAFLPSAGVTSARRKTNIDIQPAAPGALIGQKQSGKTQPNRVPLLVFTGQLPHAAARDNGRRTAVRGEVVSRIARHHAQVIDAGGRK